MFLRRVAPRQQVRVLEHHPDLVGPGAVHRRAVEDDLAARQGVQSRRRPQQRRLPTPAEPDDADELAVCDVEGEVLECVHRAGLPLVHLGRSADLELRRSAHGAQNQPVFVGVRVLHELDHRAVDDGEGHREEAVPDVERLGQHLQALDRGLDVVHAVGDVGLGAQRARHRAVGLEPEPLDVVRMLAGARDPHARRLDPALTRFHVVGDEADVIEPGACELWHQLGDTDACKLIGKVSNIARYLSQRPTDSPRAHRGCSAGSTRQLCCGRSAPTGPSPARSWPVRPASPSRPSTARSSCCSSRGI